LRSIRSSPTGATAATSVFALAGELRLADLLNQLYVLLPVLDDDKHYIVRGYGPELAAYQLGHTDPNLVIRRYGKPFQGALDRLNRASDGPRVVPLRPSDATRAKKGSA